LAAIPKVPKCYLAKKLLSLNKVQKTLSFLHQLKRVLLDFKKIEFIQLLLVQMADQETFTGKPLRSTGLTIISVTEHLWLKV
jgi:hypothetical protein